MATEHRGDIQGLRAIAVLTVIAAHFGAPFLPGGFVGVDIFFVISGYLIAGLLYRDVRASGTFSLTVFWSRRARRILPAATLVTVATVAVSLFWLSLLDARDVVTDSLWATIFAANIHFAAQGTDYFAADIGISPLQHYWSLAVEEQFYVVWPVLLLGCLTVTRWVTRRGRQQRLPRRAVVGMLATLTVASFVWSIMQTGSDPTTAYFSTFTRGWELGVGALAAVVSATFLRRITHLVMSGVAFVGLAMIAAACLFFSAETSFPGYAAALPVVGTALMLMAGGGYEPTVPGKALALRPMRVIGDWSYSLYLWHWPVLVLTERSLEREMTAVESVLALAVVFALSAATYRFVETPFRNGRAARALRVPRALALYPASLALVAAAAGGSWYYTGVQGGESGDNPAITVSGPTNNDTIALVRASVEAARDKLAIPSDLTPNLLGLRDSVADVGKCDYTFTDVRILCPRGAEDGSRTVVVIGDSHARAWIPAFDKIAEEGDWTAYYLVKSQCTAAHVPIGNFEDGALFTECSDFQDWVMQQVEEMSPDLVVVASSPPVNGVYGADGVRYEALDRVAPLLRTGYDELFDELDAAAGQVTLLKDVPRSDDDPGTCLTEGQPNLGSCVFTPNERAQALADVAVASARAEGVRVVDPEPWLCYQGECPVVIGGTLSYRDTSHLTTEYAASLAGPLGTALRMVPIS